MKLYRYIIKIVKSEKNKEKEKMSPNDSEAVLRSTFGGKYNMNTQLNNKL